MCIFLQNAIYFLKSLVDLIAIKMLTEGKLNYMTLPNAKAPG